MVWGSGEAELVSREGAELSPGLLGLGLICNKVETQHIVQPAWWCVCVRGYPDASVLSLGLTPFGGSLGSLEGQEGHPSGLGALSCRFPASASPVVERRGTEVGCDGPGLGRCYFMKRVTGASALSPHPRSPSASCSGCGGRRDPCGSPFQTLPFFLLQQAQPPVPQAPCWPPCPCLPGLCSPRWTSSTCSPSTSMALPRSVSSPTSARYGLGRRWVGACNQDEGGQGRWAQRAGSQKLALTRSSFSSNIPK